MLRETKFIFGYVKNKDGKLGIYDYSAESRTRDILNPVLGYFEGDFVRLEIMRMQDQRLFL
jgi:hypothetical protein